MQYDKALGAFVEIAASRHNAIHSSEAAEIITQDRLRRAELDGHLYRLHPRVWAVAALGRSPEQVLRGSVVSVKCAAAMTTSAAWLHGWLPNPPPIPQLWVPTSRNGNHPVAQLNRWARIDPAIDITTANSISTLNRAATLCSLGPYVSPDVLEYCLDEFLRNDSLRWLLETMDRLGSRKPGGVRALRTILNDPKRAAGVSDSWFERVVATLVARSWLPPIVLQHEVSTSAGRFRLDIACPQLKLGVEAHSRTFHWGADKTDADNVRDLALSAQGWQVLYVTWSQIQKPAEFVRHFDSAARARAEQLGVELPAA